MNWNLLVLVLLGACRRHTEAPERPRSVPAQAVWVGGSDGGVWVRCFPDGEIDRCVVYGDPGGAILLRGEFVVGGPREGSKQRRCGTSTSMEGQFVSKTARLSSDGDRASWVGQKSPFPLRPRSRARAHSPPGASAGSVRPRDAGKIEVPRAVAASPQARRVAALGFLVAEGRSVQRPSKASAAMPTDSLVVGWG